jgi:hypothetical protein
VILWMWLPKTPFCGIPPLNLLRYAPQMNPMSIFDRIIACVEKIIPGFQNDSTSDWEQVTEEGKIVCEEIQKLHDRAKEAPDTHGMTPFLPER